MTSASSATALLFAAAGLALVLWAMLETERGRNIYGHPIPASYSVPAAHPHGSEPGRGAN